MPANISQWASAGLSAIQIGARGPSGYFTGFANLTTANTGTGSGMRRIRGAVSAASPVPSINRVRNRGENQYIAQRLFAAEPPEFNLTFEAYDLDAEIFLVGSTKYVLGEWDMIMRGNAIPSLQDTMTLLTREATSLEAATTGEGFANLLILSSKYRPVPGNAEWQGVGTLELQGSADPVLTTPWGLSMATPFGKSDGMTIEWFSTNPCTMDAFVGDNAIDDIPLTYTPVSADKTKAFLQSDGSALTVSAVNNPAKTATLSAAPASGAPVLIIYETTEL